MKEELKYDPEDIESLLQHKTFGELYPEEKSFVLKHISNEEEYENLRTTLLEIQSMHTDQEWFDPDPQLKEELMASFAAENRGGFRIWLNSLFVVPELPFYRRPAFQLAFGIAILVGGFFFFQNQDKEENILAQQEVSAPSNSTDAAKADNPMTEVKVNPEMLAETSPTPLPQQPAILPQAPTVVITSEESMEKPKVAQATTPSVKYVAESKNEDVATADDAPTSAPADESEFEESVQNTSITFSSPQSNSTTSTQFNDMSQVEAISSFKDKFYNSSSQSASSYSDLLDALYTAR